MEGFTEAAETNREWYLYSEWLFFFRLNREVDGAAVKSGRKED